MFCCRSHGDIGLLLEYSRGCQGICNHPPLLWIVNNIVTFKLCSQIQTKSKDFAQNQNGWFLNDSSKIVKKFSKCKIWVSKVQRTVGPMCLLLGVFLFLFLFFVFFFLLFFLSFFPLFSFFFFFLLIAWSKFALIFHIARFQFQKYKFFSFWEGTSPSDTPCVCKHAPPNHPPMSKTDVQPSVVLVY